MSGTWGLVMYFVGLAIGFWVGRSGRDTGHAHKWGNWSTIYDHNGWPWNDHECDECGFVERIKA